MSGITLLSPAMKHLAKDRALLGKVEVQKFMCGHAPDVSKINEHSTLNAQK